MRHSTLIGALALIAIGAWWLLGSDPETRVREAHAELVQALIKSDGDSNEGLSVMRLRGLEALFAATCSIAGDARTPARDYTAQELVGMIVRVRAAMVSVDLQVGEIAIEFPQDDVAVAGFQASFDALDVNDVRHMAVLDVESRMQEIDGTWQFVSFDLTER